jgi:serine/threonine protein kinase
VDPVTCLKCDDKSFTVTLQSEHDCFQQREIIITGLEGTGESLVQPVKSSDGMCMVLKIGESESDVFQVMQESRAVSELHASGVTLGIPEFSVLGRISIGKKDYQCMLSAPYGQPLKSNTDGLDLREISQFLVSILQSIHSAGWVHGDVKPSNIIRLDSLECPVSFIDFGAARKLDEKQGMMSSTWKYGSIAQNENSTHLCSPEDDMESLVYTMSELDYGDDWPGVSTFDSFATGKTKLLEYLSAHPPNWFIPELRQIVRMVLDKKSISKSITKVQTYQKNYRCNKLV